jgi:DNA-binding GntR family transcriptional regulator
MQSISRKESLSTLAYRSIKDAIMNGELQPGQSLKEEDLSKELSISRTPVREALKQLSCENLIEKSQSHCYRVSSISMEDIRETLELREILETYSMTKCVQCITKTELTRLKRIYKKQLKALEKEDYNSFLEYEDAFHRIIILATKNHYIEEMMERIANLQRRFLILSGSLSIDCEGAMKEHEQMIKALESKDQNEAASAMSQHINNVRKRLEESV